MRKRRNSMSLVLLLCTILLATVWSAAHRKDERNSEYKLVWADEFDKDGLPNPAKWGYDVGDGCPKNCGWGNNELQYYTSGLLENARVEDGHLIIEAHRQQKENSAYTSSRLVSKRKGDWTYGKVVARAKLPKGVGVWPAIWMLPTDWAYGGWPESGEIDIMEFVGYIPDSLFGTIHTRRYNGLAGTQVTQGVYSPTLSDEFHEYGIEWKADRIDFMFDGKIYHTFRNNKEGFESWPFDRDFHLVLNIAVGGNWGGKMGVDTTIWPQRMVVDYVRVYQ